MSYLFGVFLRLCLWHVAINRQGWASYTALLILAVTLFYAIIVGSWAFAATDILLVGIACIW